VVNNSGEDYEGAQVRLVVGTINLVEKIRQLAQQGLVRRDEADRLGRGGEVATRLKSDVVRGAVVAAELEMTNGAMVRQAGRAPVIVKEGLSEYFIFTVEGQQTIKNRWSQRMVSFRTRDVPFEILYRYRPHQYGPKPVRFFILANDAEHKMGESPLPDGTIRVFRENGREGLSFFTAQSAKYIPIKEKIELNVGQDNQIVYERVVLDLARQNFLYDPKVRPTPPVVGWDETRKWQEEIRNYRAKPIKMEVRHVLAGDVEFGIEGVAAKLYDFHTPEYVLELKAGQKQKWMSEGTFHFGQNQKQDRVRLAGQ
jgi:hypothetical protein